MDRLTDYKATVGRRDTMSDTNEIYIEFDSNSKNESFARMVVAAFASQLDPTMEELADIKTAVSEAVTNSIIHGYQNGPGKVIIQSQNFGDFAGRILGMMPKK